MKRFNGFVVLVLFLGLIIGLGRAPEAEAGIYPASEEVTYKEYWIPHKPQFTGGCTDAGLPTNPNGAFYSEPGALNKCPKTMTLNIPDNLSGALRAEVYVDMWRTDDRISPRLRINNGATVYAPPRGFDWSRTPWLIQVPLSSLQQGSNTFLFWSEFNKYHIYDVAVRIYFDDTHPLLSGGVPVTAPSGELLTLTADNGVEVAANTGGMLLVNDDKVTLKANVGPGAKVVEFHAFYEGYDDDNDGIRHDWHNVNRNNWNPGGTAEAQSELGSTINNIGNVKAPPAGGQVSITWDMKHIVNQSGVRFKIRVLTADGVAREGAGGVTPEYSLVRNYPVVYYTMPGFDDFGLHMDGNRPDVVNYTFPLPSDLDLSMYDKAFLLGMYWKKPQYSLNGSKPQGANPGDEWPLGIRELTKSLLLPGNNALSFVYAGGGGSAVEHPGPMIVLKGNYSTTPDLSGPYLIDRVPAPSATNVDVFAPVSIRMGDFGAGIDTGSVIMSVNEQLVQPKFSGPSNNLTITFTPQAPFPANTTIPVTIFACDLFANCMTSAAEYSFTTEPPDLTPPVISNINVVTTNTAATVTWTTDEGATSKIEYGLTNAYEKPAVVDNALVTQHSFTLDGLQANSNYNFRLSGTDYNNNTATTTNLVFHTKRDPGSIRSDDFSSCVLDTSVWSYINPKNDSPLTLTGAGAQIAVPAGSSHDLWKQGLQAPRLMQFVTDEDFDVEVKFDSLVTKKTQSMGILIQQDPANWLRFNVQNDGPGTNSIAVVDSNKNNPQVVFSAPATLGASTYLRLNRAGSFWNLQFSSDGANWSFVTTITRTLVVSEMGAYIGNTGPNPAFVGVIDYFQSLDAPLQGDDPAIALNVTKEGVGTVTKLPDKASYACNETVTLTAAPAPDWVFAGWSGAINSTNLVETITLTQSENVMATFTNDTPYTMNVNVVSEGEGIGGSVTRSPDQGSYLYGTEVQLTAVPTPGWSFVGWSGDYIGTEPVAIVPVSGNMNITATFQEDEYTVETLIIAEGVGAGGTITVEPDQATYSYGDEVTFTVAPEPGWTFVGWEGEGISGTNLVTTITMTQDVVGFAHLVQNQYDLAINIVNEGIGEVPGNGVLKDPDQTTYGHGQQVTLSAVADLGWLFSGWSGDLSGSALTQTLTITEDKDITATFTQQQYTVTVSTQGPGVVTIDPIKPYYVYGDVVTLTPVPEQGYDFALWNGDYVGTDAPLFLAVTQDFDLEAVFVVDTTPIEIVSHDLELIGTVAKVTWTTDVPGTSRVDYGITPFYELGTVTKDDLETEHDILLTSLQDETTYYYQITSVDQFGNQVQSEALTFSTSDSSSILSDDFSSCALQGVWTWVDPLSDSSHSVTGQQAQIIVPAGTQHNLWSTGINVPRLMQPANDKDFTLDVKFDSTLVDGGAMQGILIEQDAQNFLRFNFYKRTDPAELVLHAYSFTDLVPKQIGTNPKLPDAPAPMYMRIVRLGNTWQQWYSFDGENWIKNVEFDFTMQVKKVGVFAGNTSFRGNTPGHTMLVDYFINSASPIAEEDSRYLLNIEISGSGTVQANPDKSGYYCGEQVTLTAVGAPGWGFIGWGGDLSGSNPTRNVNVMGDMNIEARFQQGAVQYSLALPMVIRP